jgi:DNA-binding MarR family transcriptional regulator
MAKPKTFRRPPMPSNLQDMARLDALLCFATYSTGRAFERLYRPFLSKIGLTYPQLLVMLAVWETGGLTMKALSEQLMLESSTLTPLVKKLEAAGLVKRSRNVTDERLLDITPTKKGMSIRQEGCEAAYIIAVSGGLTLEELTGLKEKLIHVRKSLNEATASAGG